LSLTGLLDAYKMPLILLAVEAYFVFFLSHHLLLIMAYPQEAVKHFGFLWQTVLFVLITLGVMVAGFLLVSPLFVIGQGALAVVVGGLMFLFWPRLTSAMSKGPLKELVWGGVVGLIGLGMLIWSVRPLEWERALAGLVVGVLGFWMMFSGLRKMWRGEDEEEPPAAAS
jgi:hypothetical protein